MSKKITRDRAIKNAIASVKMEGFNVNLKLEEQCKLVMNGKLSLKDCIAQISQKGL